MSAPARAPHRPLDFIAAFRRLERCVTTVTGWQPREDDDGARTVANV